MPDTFMEKDNLSSICPRCFSENITEVEYMGVRCVVCHNCGYDERNYYEVYPEERTNQKQKGKFTPYKVGGSRRTTDK